MAQQSSGALLVTTPSEREIVMTRTFDAPRRLVFEAHSKPEHMKRWWGPRRHEMTVSEMDFARRRLSLRPSGAGRRRVRVQGRVSRDSSAGADRLDVRV